MTEKLEKAQDIFLDKISQMCGKFGLNNIMAQLYTILYLVDKPLSLDDMVDRLKISKGSASVNIRALERYGVVKKVWVKGSRKDYYRSEQDISKVIIDRIKSTAKSRLGEIDDMVNSSYNAINSIKPSNKEEKEAIKKFKHRIDEVKKLYNKTRSIFNLFNSKLLTSILNVNTKKGVKEETPEWEEVSS